MKMMYVLFSHNRTVMQKSTRCKVAQSRHRVSKCWGREWQG